MVFGKRICEFHSSIVMKASGLSDGARLRVGMIRNIFKLKCRL
jgi:hypothetical protein